VPATRVIRVGATGLSREELRICSQAVQDGGVLVFPTDTVYGVGCSAFSAPAIERIYELKGRQYSKPLPVLIESAEVLNLVAAEVSPEARRLTRAFWPGPLTLVLSTAPLALNATRGKTSIAVRVPDHPVALGILAAAGLPLATTSANASGEPSVKTGADAVRQFEGKVDVIVDGGDCPLRRESSVIDATHYPFSILRAGALSAADVERALAPDNR
jgi:L-threonylcarbamoyladenylate synthase